MALFTAKKNSIRGRKDSVITVHGNDIETLHRLGVIDKDESKPKHQSKLSELDAELQGLKDKMSHQPKPTSTSKAQSKGNANAAAEADELLKLAGAK